MLQLLYIALGLTVLLSSCSKKTNDEAPTAVSQDTAAMVNAEIQEVPSSEGESEAYGENEAFEVVYKDWADGKWIDDKFLDRLESTRSLDSAMKVNDMPILYFYGSHKMKMLERHTFHTFLAIEENECSSRIKTFTGGSAMDTYVAILDREKNTCGDIDVLNAEKISPEDEDREYLDVSFEKYTHQGEEDPYLPRAKYRHIRIELVWILNRDIIAGEYTDEQGKKYVFNQEEESKEFEEGAYENTYIFNCTINGEKFRYMIDVDKKNTIQLTIYNNETKFSKTYKALTSGKTVLLQEQNTSIKLARSN